MKYFEWKKKLNCTKISISKMPNILENVSLKPYNTFGITALAKYFAVFNSLQDLIDILNNVAFLNTKKLFLGGGSNILLLNDFDGLVLKNEIEGLETVSENDEKVVLKVGAGENWHSIVLKTIERNLSGIENLSLIPGTVGAAPMQNIGAYGVEIKDVFLQLEALNLKTLKVEVFNNDKCQFGYRESYFKQEGKGKYVILNVTFELSKIPHFEISYGAIQDTIASMGIKNLSVKAISDAIIKIRRSKLPDPAKIGNSGSFFKNPEISILKYKELLKKFPLMPSYPINENCVKVPAGWLIEQAGWKGKKVGNVGVHDQQALVLVNYGNGKGNEIKELASTIQESIEKKFDILISPEVNFIS